MRRPPHSLTVDKPEGVPDNSNSSRMSTAARQPSPANRWSRFTGLFPDEFADDSYWIRETGVIEMPAFEGVRRVILRGEIRPWPQTDASAGQPPRLVVRLDGRPLTTLAPTAAGPFEFAFDLPPPAPGGLVRIELMLEGVGWTNALAWLGRKTAGWPLPSFLAGPLQRARLQHKNRQLRIRRIDTEVGETLYDFSNRHSPYNHAFARRHLELGLNVVGFHTADLGIGESARCMVKAADAAGLPVAVVPLKLHCLNPAGDTTLGARLQSENPHLVNVIHVDAPQSRDIDHHHGPLFRERKYNIAYWAWELPEFPDAWLDYAQYYDEIWCPSDFTRQAVAAKLPQSVHTMPHAIAVNRPAGSVAALRAKFGLPENRFLFLFAYDLHSYSERKNPRAVLAAYRRAFPAGANVGVVIKVQNRATRPDDWAELQAATAELPGAVLLGDTLTRTELTELQAACDCFVSLHRAEGFGLAVAECMALGKPAISTDWSATAEFVDASNGCPVKSRLITLERNIGPYSKGQTWADPDVEHAAWWMQKLAADPALAAELGARARTTIEERFAPAVIGQRYRKRLEAIASW